MSRKEDDIIKRHYQEQAIKHGSMPSSTMEDLIVREKEVELICNFFQLLQSGKTSAPLRVLDLGCGNGFTLSVLSSCYPGGLYWGLDFSEDMLNIARQRNLDGFSFEQGDARNLRFADASFDVIFSERCLINILNWEEQQQALREIHRVLAPGGYYLMLESFDDGLENNNKARTECGLTALNVAYHNLYFDKEKLMPFMQPLFTLLEPEQLDPQNGAQLFQSNFLSSHYFIARVLHPLVTKGEWVRNTEFVKFFSYLPPVGNYSPIQAYIFKKA